MNDAHTHKITLHPSWGRFTPISYKPAQATPNYWIIVGGEQICLMPDEENAKIFRQLLMEKLALRQGL